MLAPTPLDRSVANYLAHLAGKHPLFDITLQSLIHHYVLGGLFWAAALFVLWVSATARNDSEQRRRLLTVMMGSLIAIALAMVARRFMSWAPPRMTLDAVYPRYIELNWARNSFPSDSTTLYASLSSGIYWLSRRLGTALWAGVVLLVALPRMYVGGHYLTDVVVAILLGMAGFALARRLFHRNLIPKTEQLFRSPGMISVAAQCLVFFYLLQVSIEFRDMVWLKNSIDLLREAAAKWPHALR